MQLHFIPSSVEVMILSSRTILKKISYCRSGTTFWCEGIPSHSFNQQINSSASLSELKRIHALVVKNGLHHDLILCSKLIFCACSFTYSMKYPRKVFDSVPVKDAFLWNTVIRGYSDFGPCHEALILYKEMYLSGLAPDMFTFPSVLRCCGILSASRVGKGVYCTIIKLGFRADVLIQSALAAMYFQIGETADAELIFSEMYLRNVVSWTTMVAGYAQNGSNKESLDSFRKMAELGIQPNAVTLVSILPACSALGSFIFGKLIHGYVVKLGENRNITVTNALIAFYGKCTNVHVARSLFDSTVVKNQETWNTMIAVYEQNDSAKAAIRLFHKMQSENVGFDYITLVSLISACGKLGELDTGKWVHKLAASKHLLNNASIANALIYMYSKCGSMAMAKDVFDGLSCKSVVTWTTMIGACASHGNGETAMRIFSQMRAVGIQPNTFTFTALLTACRHSGLVEEGRKLFDCMVKEYKLVPGLEHCSCMVDLLGRSGCLVEAYEFIKRMPVEADDVIWGALLGACKMHHNLELAELLIGRLFLLDSGNLNYYNILSNIYAEAGRWEDVARLKRLVEECGQKKVSGHSSVEVITDCK